MIPAALRFLHPKNLFETLNLGAINVRRDLQPIAPKQNAQFSILPRVGAGSGVGGGLGDAGFGGSATVEYFAS